MSNQPKTLHDFSIGEISAISESLGYRVKEKNLGTSSGPDIVVENPISEEKVAIESELGHSRQHYDRLSERANQFGEKEIALVLVTPFPKRSWEKCPEKLTPRKSFFVVAGPMYRHVIGPLLVKILS